MSKNTNTRPRPFPTTNHALVWFKVWIDGAATSQLIGIPASKFPTAAALGSTNQVVADSANELMQEIHVEILDRFHTLTNNEHVADEERLHIRGVRFKAPKLGRTRRGDIPADMLGGRNRPARTDAINALKEGRKRFRDTGFEWEPKGRWVPGVDANGTERLVWENEEGVIVLPLPQGHKPKRKDVVDEVREALGDNVADLYVALQV